MSTCTFKHGTNVTVTEVVRVVSLFSLLLVAAVVGLLAAIVAWLRVRGARVAGADALAAGLGALAALIAACVFYGISYPPEASPAWRQAGSLALLASPLTATLALRLRGRRSMPRALTLSGAVLVVVVLWLTVHLKGVRGGWTAFEIASTTATAAAAIAAAACLGWWSKRTRPAPDDGDTR